jgi:class 3 adenylate cyclase
LESWQNALAHARQANDLWLEGWPLQRMPLALTLRGQFDKAEAVALEACALTRKTQDWGEGYSVALSHLTSVAVARGDFPAAEQRAQETMLMVYRSSYPWGGARSLFALACARALHGAYAEAEDALNILVEPGHVFKEAGSIIQTFVQAFRRLLRAYSDRVDEAIEPFAGELMRAVRTDTYSLAPLCALVEIGDLLAAPSVVEHPYQALSRTADQGIFFSSGWMFLIPRILGVAAGLIRRWDAAEAHFHVAIDMATNAGALPELGRAYLDYAYMLKARDGRSGRRRAIELLSQAFPIFRKLGMAPFTKRAEQLAKALKARIPREPLAHPAYPDNLSEREVAVLLEVAQGRTIKEIADNLMLSSQSVGHHLNSLFNKVGVNSQRAAEAYVSRWGLASQTQPRGMTKATAAHERRSNRSKTQPLHIIMVTDMEASAAIIQRWGDAKAHELLRLHNSIIRECLRRYHGVEITHTGDGVEVSFSSPANAATCAVAIQKAFAKYNQEHPGHPMRVRIGLNAGEPISTEGRLFGAAVHTTFRICARARPGQILASDVIHRLVAGKGFDFIDRGRVVLKGFRGRMRLYEVRWENETAEQQV